MDKIQIFDDQEVRSIWDEEREEWLFSVQDVVKLLAESGDPRQYIKKMRARDRELNSSWGTFCTLTYLKAKDGKRYRSTVSNVSGIFRIIQSIPSPKAEPFKKWLAQVGSDRIDETVDPELAIIRAKAAYEAKGYPADWINQRMLGIKTRNELTDEWKTRGVEQGKQFAILTDIIHKGAFNLRIKDHKTLKGLKKENLRDNMTTMETAVTMFAEAAAKELSQARKPTSFDENKAVATEGGKIAGDARKRLEAATGKPVVSSENAKSLTGPVKKIKR